MRWTLLPQNFDEDAAAKIGLNIHESFAVGRT